ncbi:MULTISPECIES: TetR/AcrR family transcriptional regulator [unclassified Achromobacter]|uniref:TetR/AcrR family transcriptional regulator n=1 Tax=unclassified Achromobacter TaxID=2626865 RepID=UPI000B516062|nr:MULTISPECIES: TetR/AcrR family transcriptional regulator [unclassified Achromobacter]OWT80863.1 TetR family transcriptional regulator [Achromobacter sp. HZ34]OWT81379.1 TetR family transcriptional regulator [Achromobacter sp. HZ28]
MSAELSSRATEIADQTKLLLAAGGYHGFSYADVSKRVLIGKASIHFHFPSKADLVLTVVKRHREQARAGFAVLDQQIEDPLARLTAYADYWLECIREGSSSICICAMLAAELPMIPAEIAEEVRAYFADLSAWLATVLEQGAANGQFSLRESALNEAQAFMSTVHGAMLTARALGNAESFQAISRTAIARLTTPA